MAVIHAVGEFDLTVPVLPWSEGEGAITVVGEIALAAGDLQVLDAEGVSIDICCGAEQLRFLDDDTVVLINGIQGDVRGDRGVVDRGDFELRFCANSDFFLCTVWVQFDCR